MEKMVHIHAKRADGDVVTAFHFTGLDAQERLDAYLAKQRGEGYTVEITGEDSIERPTPTREAVYDAEIAPLMSQIIEICKRADIPVVASFQLDDRADGEAPLFCSTCIVDPTSHLTMRRMAAAQRGR